MIRLSTFFRYAPPSPAIVEADRALGKLASWRDAQADHVGCPRLAGGSVGAASGFSGPPTCHFTGTLGKKGLARTKRHTHACDEELQKTDGVDGGIDELETDGVDGGIDELGVDALLTARPTAKMLLKNSLMRARRSGAALGLKAGGAEKAIDEPHESRRTPDTPIPGIPVADIHHDPHSLLGFVRPRVSRDEAEVGNRDRHLVDAHDLQLVDGGPESLPIVGVREVDQHLVEHGQ